MIAEMNVEIYIKEGKYILAVSGGVDSVVLLDILAKRSGLELIVVHVDHGIRPDSINDAEFVKQLAEKYLLPYEQINLDLGPNASEDLARQKRYEFFNKIKQKHNANTIITAHHQDDVIETCFINLIRGTGTRGLASLKSGEIERPLLNVTKENILNYAKANILVWQEDSTNNDKNYLRNKVRIDIVPKMSNEQRTKILEIINKAAQINKSLDKEIKAFMYRGLHKGKPVLSRNWFNKLPHDISNEVVRLFLLNNGVKEIDKKTIERITINLKTLPAGKVIQASGVNITLTKRSARLKNSSK